MDDSVHLELDAVRHGWVCSGCGLFVDSIGRPIMGNETWLVQYKSISWISNKPKYLYCPKCGKPVKESYK